MLARRLMSGSICLGSCNVMVFVVFTFRVTLNASSMSELPKIIPVKIQSSGFLFLIAGRTLTSQTRK